jgi:hypothetical protein
MSGWDVARMLRRPRTRHPAIIMISANAVESRWAQLPQKNYDEYLVKPIDIRDLLERIGQLLAINWIYESDTTNLQPPALPPARLPRHAPSRGDLDDLRQLGQIGYVRGIQAKLDEIERAHPGNRVFVTEMRSLMRDLDLGQYMATLEALRSNGSPDEGA